VWKLSPKAVYVPPPIPKNAIPDEGAEATITQARIVRDQWTSKGTIKNGLGITVKVLDGEYSALFSLDREVLTGSVGRLMVSIGLEEIDETITDKDVSALVGKKVLIQQRGGKLYWYPK